MKTIKRILRLVLVFVLMISITVIWSPSSQRVRAEEMTREEAQARLSELNQKLREINEKIANILDEKDKAQAKADTYAERKRTVEEEISILQGLIEEAETNLAIKQEELDKKIIEREANVQLFKDRVRANYMEGDATTLEVLLGAASFSEFLTSAEYARRVAKHDNDLIDKLEREEKAIEEARDDIQKTLDELELDKDALDTKVYELSVLLQEAQNDISAAEAAEITSKEEQQRILAERNKIDNLWDSLMGTGIGEYIGVGNFAWPVPSFSWISSGFGWRTLYGAPNYHTGIDIAGGGIYGKKVIASDSGYVRLVQYNTTGYGYHVMIDHGGNRWTVYAHLSSIYVSVGDYVNQGDSIAAVGSTGNSTGPHLHFEIRIDGVRVNPSDYVRYYG